MNGEEILKALRGKIGEKVVFLGCLALDDINHVIKEAEKCKKPVLVIMNTLSYYDNPSDMGHWLALCINYSGGCIGFFDSYKLPIEYYIPRFEGILNSFKDINVPFRLQGSKTLVCGVYCILFAYVVSHYNVYRGFGFFNKRFCKWKFSFNDKLILRMAYKTFPMPSCVKVFCKKYYPCACPPTFGSG